MPRTGALASDPVAREAAENVFQGNGSALQAALTGFFVAAAHDPGVLFSPVSLLVGGVGSGVFAYDGRCRQPGKEAKRPRGFLNPEEVPATARVAVPGSVAALAVACAFQSGTTLLSCVRPGVHAAKTSGAKERSILLEYVASLGATALQEPSIKRAYISQFGAVEQGTVGAADLAPAADLQVPVSKSGEAFKLPWAEPCSSAREDHGEGHAIVAVDAKGLFVAMTYRSLPAGARLEPFDTTVPSLSIPVMRGLTRITPGAPLSCPAEMEIISTSSGRFEQVVAIPRMGAAPLRLYRDSETQEVSVTR